GSERWVVIVGRRFAWPSRCPLRSRHFLGQALGNRLAQEAAGLLVGREQRLDPLPQRRVAAARFIEEGGPQGQGVLVQRFHEDRAFVHLVLCLSIFSAESLAQS